MRRLILLAVLASTIAVPAAAQAANPPGVVISELRLRGPAGGNDEFVELRNAGSAPVAVGGWTLQGCTAAGAASTRATIPAGTTLPAGTSYLFTNTAASGGYTGTVPGDTSYGTGMSDTGGVQLRDGATVIDAVGAAGSCHEGAGLTFPTANGDNGFERLGGTQDTDDNGADFTGPKASSPQNLSGDTGGPPEPVLTPIHDIQGAGAASPLAGRKVTIEGVVTGVDDEIGANFTRTFPADAGIFVQERTPDASPSTSEGIFVGFVRDRAAYPPGTVVRLDGTVRENFEETRIEETIDEEPVKVGTAPVPAPTVIDPARAAAQDAATRPYYESLEGMNVRLDVGTATSGGRNKFGETFLTPGVNQAPGDRVFRDEAQPDLIAADSDAGAGDPSQPLVDTDSTTELPADLFDVVRGLEGPVGFSFGNYKVIDQALPQIEQGPTTYPYDKIGPRAADQLRLASFNVENFFPAGVENDGHVVTPEEYASKRDRIADAIGRLMSRPDVVAVQEVVDKTILDDVAAQLGGYTAYLEPGNDSRGIDVGFLVRDDSVQVSDVRQLGKDAAGPAGCSDVPGHRFDRPPLALDVASQGVRFTVLSNHFASKGARDECRAAQAAFVRDRVGEIEAAGGQAIVAGDLNSFEDEVALTTLQDGTTTLHNLWDRAPANERYSFAFDGRLQTLDHVLVTDGLAPRVRDVRYAHFDNDYYDRRNPADGHGVSDHDPPVVTLGLEPAPVALLRPAILGRPFVGGWVAGFPGVFVAKGGVTLRYRWLRCATAEASSCAAIAGATELLYRVQPADRPGHLRFEVTATGKGGVATTAASPAVAVR